MKVSKKSLILLALSGFATLAHAVDVTSISSSNYPNGWYISGTSDTSTASLDLMPSNDGDGALHFGGSAGNNGQAYVTYGAFPGGSGNGFSALGSLLALSTGSIGADLYRSSASMTGDAATDVVVKLVFSGNRQLTWENAANDRNTTQDSWFNQMMGGSGLWWVRGAATAGGTANFNTAGNFQPLSAWAAGFTPAGYGGGSLLGANVLGYTVGFGTGVGNFNGALDHLNVTYAGGTSTTFNFRAAQATPEPAPLAGLALGAVAFLRRRKRA